MAIDWDALYELAPSDTTYVKDTDDAIRSLKTATRERVTKEHEFDLASQARQGLHRAGSAVAFYQASAPTQRAGVALAAADAGIFWVDSDTLQLYSWNGSAWVEIVSAPIVGTVYIQFPGRTAPGTLWGGTTWSNISSSFAGDFFRAEGGNASAFESGEQAFAMETHTHSYVKPTSFSNRGTSATDPTATCLGQTSANTGGATGNTANETRPVNRTIRIWVRTA